MDTFVDSSWYFMRYADPHRDDAMVADGTRHWMPMDQYIGGIEHAILHLLYARFWTRVMHDLKLVDVVEPFRRLLTQGMVLNHVHSRRTASGGIEYFWPHEVDHVVGPDGRITAATLKADGSPVDYGGFGTMSKSKNNGVDPQMMIERYGADTARLFVMFAAPVEATLEWNDAAVEGSHRFLRRVWGLALRHEARSADVAAVDDATLREPARALRRELHGLLRQISQDYERLQYNTVVSGCMKMANALEAFEPDGTAGDAAVLHEGLGILLRTLHPCCPHITWVLWGRLGFDRHVGDLLDAPWPEADPQALRRETLTLMLQVAGKLRGSIDVPADADTATIERLALAAPEVQRFSGSAPPRKIVVVPGRLVNVVP